MANVAIPDMDSLLALADAKRAETKTDQFKMKIYRKRGGANFGNEHIATLDEVTVDHMAAIETWLPRLVGGGNFEIAIHHVSALAQMLGRAPLTLGGPPAQFVDFDVLTEANWTGPAKLSFPLPPKASPNTTVAGPILGPPLAGSLRMKGEAVLPSMVDRAEESRKGFEDARSRVEFERLELEKTKRTLELESLRKNQELEMQKLRNEMALAAAKTVPPPPPPPPPPDYSWVTGLVGALAPVLTTIIQNQQASQQQTQQMIAQLMAKPAIDPVLLELIAKRDDNQMPAMVDTINTMVRSQMDVLKFAAETLTPEQPNPITTAISEVAKAAAAMSSSMQSAAKPPRRPRLPAGPSQPPPQPQQGYPLTAEQQQTVQALRAQQNQSPLDQNVLNGLRATPQELQQLDMAAANLKQAQAASAVATPARQNVAVDDEDFSAEELSRIQALRGKVPASGLNPNIPAKFHAFSGAPVSPSYKPDEFNPGEPIAENVHGGIVALLRDWILAEEDPKKVARSIIYSLKTQEMYAALQKNNGSLTQLVISQIPVIKLMAIGPYLEELIGWLYKLADDSAVPLPFSEDELRQAEAAFQKLSGENYFNRYNSRDPADATPDAPDEEDYEDDGEYDEDEDEDEDDAG